MLDETTYKIAISSIILIVGFIISKLGEKTITSIWRKKYKANLERVQLAHVYGLAINIISIIIALSFLKINIKETTIFEIYAYIPFILSIILLGVLIVLVVKVISYFLDKFISTSGIKSLIREYGQEQAFSNILHLLRYTLYIIFSLIALTSLGIDISSTVLFLKGILYPLLIFALILLFVGMKPFIENYFAGLYLKNMNFLRIGEQVKIKEEACTIEALKTEGLILKSRDSFSVFVPYKKLYNEQLKYREIIYDLATLEKIKNHFLAQNPSYCGPASASIVLKIFGYDITQEEFGRMAKTIVPPQKRLDGATIPGGTHPKDLISTVERITENKVKGAWVSIDKINDLKIELKTWLDNKALIIIDYKKSFLFPEAKKAHYSVCFSVRGDELVILDPSQKKGGVYFADIKKVYLGMNTYSELLKEKRGYIVLAPKGTTAYHRLEKGLIYSDPDLYNNLSNSLTKDLNSLISHASKLEEILPKSIKKTIEDHKRKEKVTRVWRPKSD